MAGHKAWCRFNNSRVAWDRDERREERENLKKVGYFLKMGEKKNCAANPLRADALKAAETYTQDKPVNSMSAYWPK